MFESLKTTESEWSEIFREKLHSNYIHSGVFHQFLVKQSPFEIISKWAKPLIQLGS